MSTTYDRLDWLEGRQEIAIDGSTSIIDPHHHLWDRPASRYLAEQLHADVTGSHNITHTVFVECGFGYDDGPDHLRPVGETKAVATEAERFASLGTARLAGIVGHADMMLGSAISEVLDAHVDAGAGLFRGIRHGTNISDDPAAPDGHHQPTPGMVTTDTFADAGRELALRNLSFDAWMYHEQLPELVVLARALPELTIVLDHLGGPLGVGRHALDPQGTRAVWSEGLAMVAECPNVVIKVGGLGMDQRFGTGWNGGERPPSSAVVANHWQPWVDTAIGLFGATRVMCESNFPVDRQCLPYPVVWNAMQRLIAGHSDADRAAMVRGTAARIYRIDLS
jgi:predicted TIM-barrel fold metal-dependent hydrolase